MLVPHCYDTVVKLQRIPPDQCVVIDQHSYTLGIHNVCTDLDQNLPRQQPLPWDHYVYMDFKYGPALPTDHQLIMLDAFLKNNRTLRILHLAIAHDSDISWFRDWDFRHSLVLDLHDVHSTTPAQQRLDYICSVIKVHRYFCVDYHHRPTGFYQCLAHY